MATEDISILHTVTETYSYSSTPQYQVNDTVGTVNLVAPDGTPVTDNSIKSTDSYLTYDSEFVPGSPTVYVNQVEDDEPMRVLSGTQPQLPGQTTAQDNYGDVLDQTYSYYAYDTVTAAPTTPSPTPTPTPSPTTVTPQEQGAITDLLDDILNNKKFAHSDNTSALLSAIDDNPAALDQDASVFEADPDISTLANEFNSIIARFHNINYKELGKAASQVVNNTLPKVTASEAFFVALGAPEFVGPIVSGVLAVDGMLKVADALTGKHYEQKVLNHLPTFLHAAHFE